MARKKTRQVLPPETMPEGLYKAYTKFQKAAQKTPLPPEDFEKAYSVLDFSGRHIIETDVMTLGHAEVCAREEKRGGHVQLHDEGVADLAGYVDKIKCLNEEYTQNLPKKSIRIWNDLGEEEENKPQRKPPSRRGR